MNKPAARVHTLYEGMTYEPKHYRSEGYNQAIDDYEKHLPTLDEIEEFIQLYSMDMGTYLSLEDDGRLAKAIYNRQQGEK